MRIMGTIRMQDLTVREREEEIIQAGRDIIELLRNVAREYLSTQEGPIQVNRNLRRALQNLILLYKGFVAWDMIRTTGAGEHIEDPETITALGKFLEFIQPDSDTGYDIWQVG